MTAGAMVAPDTRDRRGVATTAGGEPIAAMGAGLDAGLDPALDAGLDTGLDAGLAAGDALRPTGPATVASGAAMFSRAPGVRSYEISNDR